MRIDLTEKQAAHLRKIWSQARRLGDAHRDMDARLNATVLGVVLGYTDAPGHITYDFAAEPAYIEVAEPEPETPGDGQEA